LVTLVGEDGHQENDPLHGCPGTRPITTAAVPPEKRRHRDVTALVPELRDTKECAVTSEPKQAERRPQDGGERARNPEKLGNLEVWARSAPIRLAGYEDDLAEPHILQGVD
jgi:hypothetical protein